MKELKNLNIYLEYHKFENLKTQNFEKLDIFFDNLIEMVIESI
jgi:hypothetical protein